MADEIIIFEPNTFYRTYVVDMLQLEHFEVLVASNLQDLVQTSTEKNPALAVMDMAELGERDAEFLKAFKKNFPMIPVIALIDAEKRDLVARYIRGGVFDCVEKPVVREALLLAVKKAVQFMTLGREKTERIRKLRRLATGTETLLKIAAHKKFLIPKEYPGGMLVQSILDTIAMVFDAEKVSLCWMDREMNKYYVAACAGYSMDIRMFQTRALGEGIVGKVADTKEAIFVRDLRLDKRYKQSVFKEQYKSNSFMCGPILFEDEAVAVVSVSDRKDGRSYSEEDFFLFKSFLSQITYAMESSFLISQHEKNTKRLHMYKEMSEIVNRNKVNEMLRSVLESISRYVGAQGCVLYILEGGHFTRESVWGMNFKELVAYHKFLTKFIEEDMSSFPAKNFIAGVESLALGEKVRNFVSFPVQMQDFPTGFFILINLFSDATPDKTTLEDFRCLVSIAFKNHWLYKNLYSSAGRPGKGKVQADALGAGANSQTGKEKK